MSEHQKLLGQILLGRADANIAFNSLCRLLRSLGFEERIKRSPRIFTKEGIVEILNLQPRVAGKSKPYQVKQARQVILKHRLGGLE